MFTSFSDRDMIMWFITGGVGHGALSPARQLPTYELDEEMNKEAEKLALNEQMDVDFGGQSFGKLPLVFRIRP